MAVIIPTSTDGEARYDFECDLDDVTYQFTFEWNDRDEAWYMTLADVNGVPLVSGRKVVLGYALLNLYADSRLPQGAFYAVDTSGGDIEPGLLDLGGRVKLLYFSASEIA